jgi:hypothetical protein
MPPVSAKAQQLDLTVFAVPGRAGNADLSFALLDSGHRVEVLCLPEAAPRQAAAPKAAIDRAVRTWDDNGNLLA